MYCVAAIRARNLNTAVLFEYAYVHIAYIYTEMENGEGESFTSRIYPNTAVDCILSLVYIIYIYI